MDFTRLFRRAVCGLLFLVALAGAQPAFAQNYDGATLLKFGVFGQAGSASYDVTGAGLGSASRGGFGGGVSLAYDYSPMRTWLLGLEIDGAVGDWGGKQIGTTKVDVDHLVNARLRAGHYVHNDMLLYAHAGLAIAGTEWRNIGVAPVVKRPETLTGWSIGGGVEWAWNHVLLFADYSFAGFGDASFVASGVRNTVSLDTHMFRLGVKFKTGWDHYHDDLASRDRPMK